MIMDGPSSGGRRRQTRLFSRVAAMIFVLCLHETGAFVLHSANNDGKAGRVMFVINRLAISLNDNNDRQPLSADNDEFMNELKQRAESIDVEKMRNQLEAANTQRFLKRKPVKLPYEDARRWVQANLGPNTEEEFFDLVANGNLRTPYIPKNPERYYTSTREWISWDHFLKGLFDKEKPSAIRPVTGVFD